MTETYQHYCSGINNSFRLLAELKDYQEFNEFLQEPPLHAGQPTISNFIQKPLEHIKKLFLNLQKISNLTPLSHQDTENLSQVIEGKVFIGHIIVMNRADIYWLHNFNKHDIKNIEDKLILSILSN